MSDADTYHILVYPSVPMAQATCPAHTQNAHGMYFVLACAQSIPADGNNLVHHTPHGLTT